MSYLDNLSETSTRIKKVLIYLLKWIAISTIIGLAVGSASALFLYLLEKVTTYRIHHTYLLFFLPLGGLFVGLLYHYFGGRSNKGNNLLIDEFHKPEEILPLKMAPLVLLGTLITHLFGGSAGREGTAIQIGGALSDQLSRLFSLHSLDRKIIILMGVSAGFSSVFGTPLAGTLFALELMIVGKVMYQYVVPCLLTAVAAHYTCISWGIHHTVYQLNSTVSIDTFTLLKVIVAGILFGLAAILFVRVTDYWAMFLNKYVSYGPLKPFIGGIVFIILILTIGDAKYLGLGVPTIEESFIVSQEGTTFLLKILFTAITLGAGFKGGEVTPLFYIGATMGSFMAIYLNVPIDFLAGIGFIAVFSGATKTPWACTIMGIELFGIANAPYIAIACIVAYFISGRESIYKSQVYSYENSSLM
ncbi:voltage-gated chloride channel family protein [Myroides injenensis]|uniref:voltage-gated chloride channel family protein n=1 Tax=Myroides injenensis TaxID=1183151 RepID=UPI0002883A57|nr:voltage-gated chloride channel family protein [Myroides injenensis]